MNRGKLALGVITIFLCAQFGSPRSTDDRQKPETNIYGVILDTSGRRTNVENITINGRLKDVPVYAKPADPDINPDVNTTRINLTGVCSIRLLSPQLFTFSKREYVEIEIIFNDPMRTRNTFIIDKRRKVYCDSVDGSAPMELSFQAISVLNIQGHKPQTGEVGAQKYDCQVAPQPSAQPQIVPSIEPEQTKEDEEIDLLITKTNQLIDRLERESHQLPDKTKKDRSIKSSIISTVEHIKSSLSRLFS